MIKYGVSVVLPAFNEEQNISTTVTNVITTLNRWQIDFEVIVVNDGSWDATGHIVRELAEIYHPQVHLVEHSVNQGYGAALVSGFAAASKSLTFFMDADGQFLIAELYSFFSFIDDYGAVIGHRINRQDSLLRKLNAWGWKMLVSLVLNVHVRDIDCAFKLIHTNFLQQQQHLLETRGAMINAELLYKLKHADLEVKEVGVHHLPRCAGKATGAQISVILRALRELFTCARKWNQEEF